MGNAKEHISSLSYGAVSAYIKSYRKGDLKMSKICKLCGAAIKNTATYLNSDGRKYTCGECGSYCMNKCEIASRTTTSWHREPCVSCEHNPYRIQHTWDGKEWVKNGRSI